MGNSLVNLLPISYSVGKRLETRVSFNSKRIQKASTHQFG